MTNKKRLGIAAAVLGAGIAGAAVLVKNFDKEMNEVNARMEDSVRETLQKELEKMSTHVDKLTFIQ